MAGGGSFSVPHSSLRLASLFLLDGSSLPQTSSSVCLQRPAAPGTHRQDDYPVSLQSMAAHLPSGWKMKEQIPSGWKLKEKIHLPVGWNTRGSIIGPNTTLSH